MRSRTVARRRLVFCKLDSACVLITRDQQRRYNTSLTFRKKPRISQEVCLASSQGSLLHDDRENCHGKRRVLGSECRRDTPIAYLYLEKVFCAGGAHS